MIWVEAEFAVQVAGLDVLVGVALDAGGEAQHKPGRRAAGGHQLCQSLEIVLVIDNDCDVVRISEQKFVIAFVVSMQHIRSPGMPPWKAVRSSPAETASRPRPSEAAILLISKELLALEA